MKSPERQSIGKCTIVKNEYGEYQVKVWDTSGQRFEKADYYTDSINDAKSTMQEMMKYAYTKDGI